MKPYDNDLMYFDVLQHKSCVLKWCYFIPLVCRRAHGRRVKQGNNARLIERIKGHRNQGGRRAASVYMIMLTCYVLYFSGSYDSDTLPPLWASHWRVLGFTQQLHLSARPKHYGQSRSTIMLQSDTSLTALIWMQYVMHLLLSLPPSPQVKKSKLP